ncbi:MAG TPA: DUF99 family protein [Thermoplasmatales archaeon]|nr:DUF99 family protein [Thermoplasmatales archaeon]
MKKEIRILGIDDMPFSFGDRNVDIIGVVMRGGVYLEGVLKSTIEVDGMDSTSKIIEMVEKTKHKKQLKLIMLDGVALGGFNVVDCEKIYEKTGLPVITVTRNKPNMEKIKKALKKHFENWEERWNIINKGKTIELKIYYTVYTKYFGLDEKEAMNAIKLSIIRGAIPEPIRVAHLIATGIKKGESQGRC